MPSKFLLPVILFFSAFIIIIITLVVLRSKRKSKYKKEIEELDYEKNQLIGVPILSELSKVRELVKTDDLKQKLAD
jgi:septation ring formation regulator EzrA